MKKVGSRILMVFQAIFGLIGGYLGVLSTLLGTILGILSTLIIVLALAGIFVYVKVIPVFTEAREAVFDNMINMSEEDFVMNDDTEVYDDKGKKLGVVNAGRFKYTKISDISPYLYNGYIAVEDKRFKTHAGVDFLATMRAGVSLMKNRGEITQGGSTITQQVVKNNLLSQEQTYTRKIAEIMLAPVVEQKFGKDKIMEFYCNSNYFGNRCYGVFAASKYYFGKKPADLEPAEAALLISLSNSPSAYNPVAHPKASRKKRNEVLLKMFEEQVITKKEYNKGRKASIDVLQLTEKATSESYLVSYAVHCAALSLMEKENFAFQYTFKDKADYDQYQDKYSKAYGEKSDAIRSGGYKIYTTLNRAKQKKLQSAIDSGLAYSTEMSSDGAKYALQGAAVCVDNKTNYVVAVVGGRGTKDAFNRAYLSARQSGSSIKPLIDYAPGFESGIYSPSTVVDDHAIDNGPKNSGGSYRGRLHVREAVARSINTIAWQVMEVITPEYGLSFLDKMHFHNLSYVDNGNMALSLGGFTEGVRVVDMAKGYSTLANGGEYSDRTCIKKIKHGSEGTVYQDAEETTAVYSEDTAWLMTDVLKGVFNESYGTAHALKLNGDQITAGKTGTTNSSKDVWFCGYTAYYTTVVWCGYDTPRAMPGTYGATLSGGIWKNFMNEIHEGLEPQDFVKPDSVVLAQYDSEGKMINGTESSSSRRTYGTDFFSTEIVKDTTKYVSNATDKAYQKKVLKKLRKFEKMSITKTADYYSFEQTYSEVKNMIATIKDDAVRKEYSTRCKDKYESLEDESLKWKDIVAAYQQWQSEENQRIAEESARRAEEAREEQVKNTRIGLAQTRLKRLQGHKYKPDNATSLIKAAKDAVNACQNYAEYTTLQSNFESYSQALLALPTKQEYQDSKKPRKTPAPADEEEDE